MVCDSPGSDLVSVAAELVIGGAGGVCIERFAIGSNVAAVDLHRLIV